VKASPPTGVVSIQDELDQLSQSDTLAVLGNGDETGALSPRQGFASASAIHLNRWRGVLVVTELVWGGGPGRGRGRMEPAFDLFARGAPKPSPPELADATPRGGRASLRSEPARHERTGTIVATAEAKLSDAQKHVSQRCPRLGLLQRVHYNLSLD